ncbi:hypothetical protein PsYK624_063100 [Phanerochaete sordida]|uniref:Uncharacterized protein n=1 Tax=Phanerochaete sordida TaxID=48140 RepID=A0A9P3GA65_9APHY|nr:hypothetical protein PsYK624_063100 [Phanerochaete sordida]
MRAAGVLPLGSHCLRRPVAATVISTAAAHTTTVALTLLDVAALKIAPVGLDTTVPAIADAAEDDYDDESRVTSLGSASDSPPPGVYAGKIAARAHGARSYPHPMPPSYALQKQQPRRTQVIESREAELKERSVLSMPPLGAGTSVGPTSLLNYSDHFDPFSL